LSLTNADLRDTELALLFDGLIALPALHSLHLAKNKFTSTSARTLAQVALCSFPFLYCNQSLFVSIADREKWLTAGALSGGQRDQRSWCGSDCGGVGGTSKSAGA
jgi:hypothetical protein